MITRRTDELRAGDRVHTDYGVRTVSGAETGTGTTGGLIRVGWVRDSSRPGPYAAYASPDEEWQVDAPSKLDEAVRRAQELADGYDGVGSEFPDPLEALDHFAELLDTFRDAR